MSPDKCGQAADCVNRPDHRSLIVCATCDQPKRCLYRILHRSDKSLRLNLAMRANASQHMPQNLYT